MEMKMRGAPKKSDEDRYGVEGAERVSVSVGLRYPVVAVWAWILDKSLEVLLSFHDNNHNPGGVR
jgi:hypothetical protein